MTKSGKIAKREDKQLGYLDDIFENFRSEVESALRPWHEGFKLSSLFSGETRLPLCDMADRGDRYELQVEVPGIEKGKINVKATNNSVEISADKSEKTEEKRKGLHLQVTQVFLPQNTRSRGDSAIESGCQNEQRHTGR